MREKWTDERRWELIRLPLLLLRQDLEYERIQTLVQPCMFILIEGDDWPDMEKFNQYINKL